jgi:hypothetical protein
MPNGQNLIFVAASKSRPSDKWADDDYDVSDGKAKIVGRIVRANAAPPGRPWFWTITERALQRPTDLRYAATREDAMADFKGRWSALV